GRPRREGDRRPPRVRPARGRRGGALAARARRRGGAQHPAARARRARRGGDPAAGGDRRGGEARPLVRGSQGPGLRERRARRRGPGVGRAVGILLVNWNDREHPHAGGAGIPLPEIFGRTLFQEAPWPLAALVWLSERPLPWAYRHVAFQAVSESTRADLVARGVAPEHIEVIPEGIDTAWFRPDPATPRATRPTFLYVGRLKRYKGLEIALRALAQGRRIRPDLALEIAGQGDDRPRLEGLARELGLGDAVRFRGFVSE